MTEKKKIIIGSRGSELALWQANHVKALLRERAGVETDIKIIKTSGDRFLEQSLQQSTDKGFFTKEIEEELLAGSIDLAVHSLKDLPTQMPPGLMLGATSARVGVADLLLLTAKNHDPSAAIPVKAGGKIGATSLRRQSLLKRYAPSLQAAMLRGNVPSRIEKLRRGDYDAIIIARAGVERLGLDLRDLLVFEINPAIWLPAPAQAVLGIQIRENDPQIAKAIEVLHDANSQTCIHLERELLRKFEGGCHSAFGSWAEIKANGRLLVKLGYEDPQGNWKATELEAENSPAMIEQAYQKMQQVLSGQAPEPAAVTDWLCRPFQL